MFDLSLSDVLIAIVAFGIGFLAGVGSRVELKQLWFKKRRRRSGKKH